MNRHWSVSTHLVTDQETEITQLRRSRLSKRRISLRNDRSILLNKKNHSIERIERLNSFDLDINQSISLSCYLQFERKTIHRHDSQRTIELFRNKQICSHNQISSSSNLANFSRCQQKFQSILISLILIHQISSISLLSNEMKIILNHKALSLAKSIKTTSCKQQ